MYNETAELTTKSILALFETNKAQRKSFVDDVINRLNEGEINPLVVHLQLKAMEDIITQLTSNDKEKNKNLEAAKEYKKHLAEAFTKYSEGQKSFDYHNATFRQMEAGTKYNFESCGDPKWDEINSRINELLFAKKLREDFLKTVPASGLELRYDDELFTIWPPSKTSTTTVSCTLR